MFKDRHDHITMQHNATTMSNRSVQVKVRIQVGFVLVFILDSLMVHPLCQTSTVPAKERLCRMAVGTAF